MISFFVPGIPATAGSKTPFVNKKTGKVSMVPANKKQKPWMAIVRSYAQDAYAGPLFRGAIQLECKFYLPRPKGHYGTGKNADRLKPSAPAYPVGKPDCTKLLRAAEDALKGVIWHDDAQVVKQVNSKNYGDQPGVEILISGMD